MSKRVQITIIIIVAIILGSFVLGVCCNVAAIAGRVAAMNASATQAQIDQGATEFYYQVTCIEATRHARATARP